MIQGKSVLAVMPARGGSKGMPRKNIREIAGKPLIAWTIEAAKKSKYIDRLIISSEDTEIINVAKRLGCEAPFIRPAELAQDNTPGIEPVLHAIRSLPGYDYVVLLQPTSPFRTCEDIDGCIELCENKHANSCVSVAEPDKSPYWMFTINAEGKMRQLINQKEIPARRQDLPKVYVLNGAVYVADAKCLLKRKSFLAEDTVPYIMGRLASIDLDTEEDFVFAEFCMRSGGTH
jgi:CMP-N,N'-diacetyllegionaminic acid synthase